MYVCLCNAVTDRDIHEAVASGARSLAELSLRTGCSDTCGTCAEQAEQILHDALGTDGSASSVIPLPVLQTV